MSKAVGEECPDGAFLTSINYLHVSGTHSAGDETLCKYFISPPICSFLVSLLRQTTFTTNIVQSVQSEIFLQD